MALVSESFLHGAPYSLPGAGLTLSGTVCEISDTESYNFGMCNDDSQYSSQRLATVMATATQNLSVTECKSEYQACQGLRKHRNLLLVIGTDNGPTDSQVWVVSDIYDMEDTVANVYNVSALASAMELSDNKLQNETFRFIWEPYFEDTSMSQWNSLWFSSTCYKVADRSTDGCDNIYDGSIGTSQSYYEPRINETEVKSMKWEFPWIRGDHSISTLRSRSTWAQLLDNTTRGNMLQGIRNLKLWPDKCIGIPRPSYRRDIANNIRVQYCLAESSGKGCKVAVSNMLFLVVTVCIFIKLVLCMIVVWALRDDPLVTTGDAMASFIIIPRLADAQQQSRPYVFVLRNGNPSNGRDVQKGSRILHHQGTGSQITPSFSFF